MFDSRQWGQRPHGDLGHLERELMERVWEIGESSVTQVHDSLSGRLAYTTIMTTLDRLYKKGLLERRKQGRAFLYSARVSKTQYKQGLVKKALAFLMEENKQESGPLMAHLVETFRQHDTRLLDELEKLIQQSKRRREK
jgi:predicted transcriptional regulator